MTTGCVFGGLAGYGFVHHRAMNTREALTQASYSARSRPDLAHIVEGDLCWLEDGGDTVFYMRHPRRLTDTLSRREVDAGLEDGSLLTLDAVIESYDPHLKYVFELKAGRGDSERAMAALAGRLQEALPGHYWVDSFSLRLLEALKRVDSRVPVSLHAVPLRSGRLLQVAPESRSVGFWRAGDLTHMDAITLSWRSGWVCSLPRSPVFMAGEEVVRAGKALVIGGLECPVDFMLARELGAVAGYGRFPIGLLPGLDGSPAQVGADVCLSG